MLAEAIGGTVEPLSRKALAKQSQMRVIANESSHSVMSPFEKIKLALGKEKVRVSTLTLALELNQSAGLIKDAQSPSREAGGRE